MDMRREDIVARSGLEGLPPVSGFEHCENLQSIAGRRVRDSEAGSWAVW